MPTERARLQTILARRGRPSGPGVRLARTTRRPRVSAHDPPAATRKDRPQPGQHRPILPTQTEHREMGDGPAHQHRTDELSGWVVDSREGAEQGPLPNLLSAAVLLLSMVSTVAMIVGCGASSGDDRRSSAQSCRSRVVVIDGSSSARSNKQQVFVRDVVVEAAEQGIVCDSSFQTAVVSGPGQVRLVVSPEDVNQLTPDGPNPTIRASRFNDQDREQLRLIIEERLAEAYVAVDAGTTSLATMITAAADLSNDGTAVLFLTDGVNEDEFANLNRPLAEGEGTELAGAVPAVMIEADSLSFIGVGLVDATTPAPSPQWDLEVRDFVAALCARSTTNEERCTVRAVASIEEVLQ